MVHRSLPVAALLLGLAAAPGFSQTRQAEPPATDAAAVRTLEQNRRVSVGLPPAAAPRSAEARPSEAKPGDARPGEARPGPQQRRLALAAQR